MKILMVYPTFPDTFWSFKHALEFIDKKINNQTLKTKKTLSEKQRVFLKFLKNLENFVTFSLILKL